MVILIIFLIPKKEEKVEEVLLEKEEIKEQTKKIIKVDIKGAINNPGVYELEENDTVLDVINKSGGLLEEADTSTINLSKNVFNEMVIIIYTKKEIDEMKKGSTAIKYIEKECICPKLENDACIEDKITNNPSDTESTNNGKVSINKATLEELMTLSGIGESKAKDIIEYREKNGLFTKIEDIMNVSGIGTKTFEKIKDQLTL